MKRDHIVFRYCRILFGFGLLVFGLTVFAGSGFTPTLLPSPGRGAFEYDYGHSVALTPDGSLAVVGADNLSTASLSPAVYVFQYANGAWNTTPIITICDPDDVGIGCSDTETDPSSLFATAVAISSINNGRFILVVGAPGGDVLNGSAGVVYLYQCSLNGAPSCTQVSRMADPAANLNDFFGKAVAISSDGNTVLIGALGTTEPGGPGVNNVPEPLVGSAYVYSAVNGMWTPTPAVTATLNDPAPTCGMFVSGAGNSYGCNEFGSAVALSGTGSALTALIGAPAAVEKNTGTLEPAEGQAFIFSSSGGSWSLLPVTTFIDPNKVACNVISFAEDVCDRFGASVALSADGSIALVGAPDAVPAGSNPPYGEAGVVNLYTQSNGSWSDVNLPAATFSNPDTQVNSISNANFGFGWSLAVSNNGGSITVLVGNPEATEGTNNGGDGYTGEMDLYTCNISSLPSCVNSPVQTFIDPSLLANPSETSPPDYFGTAVAMSSGADVLLAGAPNDANDGAAYVYGATAQAAPVATNGNLITAENSVGSGVLSATGTGPLTFAIVTQPTSGTATLTNAATGAFTYTPNSGFSGTDSFTFTASNSGGTSNTATESITVTPSASPVAENGSATGATGTVLSGTLQATDPITGRTLTYIVVGQPSDGTLVLTGANTGTFTYTPTAGFVGTDSFTFKVNDGFSTSNVATETLVVTAMGIGPVANNGNVSTPVATPVSGTLSATDSNAGATLTFSIVSNVNHGTATITNAATGAFTYTPSAEYFGPDSFTFEVKDSTGATSNVATESITVTAPLNGPIAVNGTLTTNENVAANGLLVATDSNPGVTLTYTVIQPAHGTLTQPDGKNNAAFTYTPANNYSGQDSFTFSVYDGSATSNTATVTITVNAGDTAPVTKGGAYQTSDDTPVSGTLSATNPVSGTSLTYSIVTEPAHGSVTLTAATGAFTYTPATNYSGQDSFTFSASNGVSTSNVSTVNILIFGATGSHSSGGGGFAWLELAAFAGLLMLRRRRARKLTSW
ncbi:MAG: Ig-like domain-containing protein [Gammaproteobacteria bacterium]